MDAKRLVSHASLDLNKLMAEINQHIYCRSMCHLCLKDLFILFANMDVYHELLPELVRRGHHIPCNCSYRWL